MARQFFMISNITDNTKLLSVIGSLQSKEKNFTEWKYFPTKKIHLISEVEVAKYENLIIRLDNLLKKSLMDDFIFCVVLHRCLSLRCFAYSL